MPIPGFLFGLLRVIRAFSGFIFGSQIVYLIQAVFQLSDIGKADGTAVYVFLSIFSIKLVVAALFGFLFFALRRLINHLYMKEHGTAHPALTRNKWAL
jgi:hypothetical protein